MHNDCRPAMERRATERYREPSLFTRLGNTTDRHGQWGSLLLRDTPAAKHPPGGQ
jgi:hypothetical protein